MKITTFLLLLIAMPLMAVAQLQNTDFEEWINPVSGDNAMPNRPVGWSVISDISLEPNEWAYCYYPPVTGAQSGNYALRLGIWYNHTKDMAVQTAPISTRPLAVKGFYTYTDNLVSANTGALTDKASVAIFLTKRNDVTNKNDTIGEGKIFLDAVTDYTAFRCPVTYTSAEMPDSVTLVLDCSLMQRGVLHVFADGGTASYFTVDNIVLESETMEAGGFDKNGLKVYPNPVKDVLNMKGFSGVASVYDITGKQVMRQINVQENGVDVSGLNRGVYVLKLEGDTVHQYKFIKQ